MDEIIKKIQSKLKKYSGLKTGFGDDYAVVYQLRESPASYKAFFEAETEDIDLKTTQIPHHL
jgi:hypothetical protein